MSTRYLTTIRLLAHDLERLRLQGCRSVLHPETVIRHPYPVLALLRRATHATLVSACDGGSGDDVGRHHRGIAAAVAETLHPLGQSLDLRNEIARIKPTSLGCDADVDMGRNVDGCVRDAQVRPEDVIECRREHAQSG